MEWRVGYNPPQDPMSLFQANALAKAYGAQDIFSGVSFSIPRQARIGLVGPNGVGKTTLLRLIAGADSPDSGNIQRARKLTIGYLPQETLGDLLDSSRGLTLWDVCLEAFDGLRRREAELAELENAMADPGRAAAAMERYGPLQEAFATLGGYSYETRIRQVLNGLGFERQAHRRPISRFSGGERTRALLASLLLRDPDLLVLDEPTNHLDIRAIEWLEAWLRDWPGAALLVSHDRYFLDHTVDSIWELTAQGIEAYRGNYTRYIWQRVERQKFQDGQYQAQQAYVARQQEFIRRNIAGQKTRQAQGRRKRLERMLSERAVERPKTEEKPVLRFRQASRSGEQVITTHQLHIGHPESGELLFDTPDLVLRRRGCAALIGPNGAGKTTFLKTILGELPPRQGEVRQGAGLKVGYFSQTQAQLDPDMRVLDVLLQAFPELTISAARHELARYGLRDDDVDKRVGDLSGGERSRLALAQLVLQGANLLLLDEPTNHLDLPSQEALQQALNEYQGTILLVSHDRYLIDDLATEIWEIVPGARHMAVYHGGYTQYSEWKAKQAADRKAERRAPPRTPRREAAKSRHQAEQLVAIEERIEMLEGALEAAGQALQAAGRDVDRVRQAGERYAAIEQELRSALQLWERLAKRSDPA
jgi:ATP-binding cassette subfamily F protein 3